jgi:hypothetical protein
MVMIRQSQICLLAIYCILIPQCSLMCNIDNVASYPSLLCLLPFKVSQLSIDPLLLVVKAFDDFVCGVH